MARRDGPKPEIATTMVWSEDCATLHLEALERLVGSSLGSSQSSECDFPVFLIGRHRAIVIAESLARVITAIRIASVRWRSYLPAKDRN